MKNVPEFRFPEFEVDWNECKIEQLLEIKHGRTQHNVECENGKYPILGTGGQIGTTNTPVYSEPSVLIGRKGTINKPRFIDTPFWTVDTLFYTKIYNQNNVKFIYYLFQTIDWLRYNEASGVPSLNSNTIKSIDIYIPHKKEQTKIASFFTAIDQSIDNLEEKIRLLHIQKDGYVSRFFSNNTEGERVKLVEIAKFTGGGTPSKSNSNYWEGSIPWISSSDILENNIHEIRVNRFINEEAVLVSATKLIQKNSIMIVSRVGVGKLAIAPFDLCTSQDFTNLTNIVPDVVYLAYALSNLMKYKANQAQGTSIKGITSVEIKNYVIVLPQLNEQKKIAHFLTLLDNRINCNNTKLNLLNEFKKGFMQKMFL